ncbi:MAG: glycosyltransferase involved in cell wall biosynthesis [Flavobacteriales bacterium]|jgi:glycosyltransferase involved in cell wall biosynthesis
MELTRNKNLRMTLDFSVVVPCYNSTGSIKKLTAEFQSVFEKIEASYEIILVNDYSSDAQTWKVIKDVAENSGGKVLGVNLFRNFGQQAATVCGFTFCKGKHVITIDDDMQHNPQDLPKLLEKKDHDIVIGRLTNRKDGLFTQFTSSIKSYFDYVVLGKPKHVRLSSFRLLRGEVVREMIAIRTPSPFVPALMFYVTKDCINVDIEHNQRFEGNTNYSFKSRLKLFSLIVINNSSFFLKIIGYIGIFALIGSASLFAYFLVAKLFFTSPPTGWTSLFSAILFFGGLTLFAVGLIGEYIIRIIPIVEMKRPFIVRELAGDEPQLSE